LERIEEEMEEKEARKAKWREGRRKEQTPLTPCR
jgi:hypothetical protein